LSYPDDPSPGKIAHRFGGQKSFPQFVIVNGDRRGLDDRPPIAEADNGRL
jgi:hypothetical protein